MLEQGQKLIRQRKTFKELNLKLFGLWDDYSEQKITTAELLEQCAEIYTNFNAIKYAKTANDARLFELEIE
jgi:hypothetical protein